MLISQKIADDVNFNKTVADDVNFTQNSCRRC